MWNFACKATAPNGRSAIGTGSCSAFEKATIINGKPMQKGKVTEWGHTAGGKSYPVAWEWEPAQPNSIHNVRTTAETRAWNRAVSNLVGGGEVSAEEVAQKHDDYPVEPEKKQPRPQQSQPRPQPKSEPRQPRQPENNQEPHYAPLSGQMTEKQKAMVVRQISRLGTTQEGMKAKFGIDHISKLTKQEASELIDKLIKMSQWE